MILADSSQILENEAVQSAIINARGYGMLIGIGIMAIVLFGALMVMNQINKNDQKSSKMTTYIRLKMEKGWIDMIDICKRCIESEIRISRSVITLFDEFPTYDQDRMAKEMEFFPSIASQYTTIVNDRSTIVKTLEDMITHDMEAVNAEMAMIENEYPKETTEYNEKLKKQSLRKKNTDERNSDSQNNSQNG